MNLAYLLRSHAPLRPMWICRACTGPWPCATARLKLKAEYCEHRADLPVFMATVMHQAILDLTRLDPAAVDPAEVFVRFIAWTQRTPERPASHTPNGAAG